MAFIQVHGFGTVTQGESPAVVMQLLNDYFEIIVPEVTAREGTPVRFDGDSVVAVFRGPEHAERALQACLAVRAQLRPHQANPAGGALYSLGVAIGVDSGTLTFGGVGSRRIGRVEWTVLGEIVARAAQLRAVAAQDEVLVGEALREHLDESAFVLAGNSRPYGMDKTMSVFNVLASRDQGADAVTPVSAPTGDSTMQPAATPGPLRRSQ